jgi:hypothetical protein
VSLDKDEIGGAPLLGINGLTIIAHGASTPKAIKNAIRVANESLQRGMNSQIVENLHALPEMAFLTADLKRGRGNLWAQIRERFRQSRDGHEPAVVELPPIKEEEKQE